MSKLTARFFADTSGAPHIWLRIGLAGGIALMAGLQLHHFVTWSPRELAIHGLIIDDAFFYSVLARNFQRFGFLTLDGELSTNGVQPLWMAIQLLLVELFPRAGTASLLTISLWVFYLLFSFGLVWYVTQGSSSIAGKMLSTLIVSGLVILNAKFQALSVNGLEIPLTLFLLVLGLILIDYIAAGKGLCSADLSTAGTIGLAVCSVFCFFARTDLFWISIVLGVWVSIVGRRELPKVVLYWSIVAVLVLPYLAFNWLSQDSLMPVSGRVKLFYLDSFFPQWSDYLYSGEWAGLMFALSKTFSFEAFTNPVKVMLTALAMLAGLLMVWFGRKSKMFPAGLQLLSLMVIAHVLFMQLFYRELRSYTSYYFAPEIIWLVSVLAFYAAGQVGRGPAWPQAPARRLLRIWGQKTVAALIVFFSLFIGISSWANRDLQPVPFWVQRMRLIEDIQQILPEQSRVSAIWPGAFAQFSGRLVTPLDGVVGSNAYFQNYVKPHKQLDYVLERSRPYVILHLPASPNHLSLEPDSTLNPWNLGVERFLAEPDMTVRVLAVRPLNAKGAGWYLVELKASPAEAAE